jgi:hypothetical protein
MDHARTAFDHARVRPIQEDRMRRTPFARKSWQGGPRKAASEARDDKSPSDAAKTARKSNVGKRRGLEDMTHGELVALLDQEVSLFVRGSPAVKSGSRVISCFTCGGRYHYKEMDCGHYIPRHRFGTRWNLDNLRPQCTRCNCYHEGEHWLYRKCLVNELGEDRVFEMEALASIWGETKIPKIQLIDHIKAWRLRNKSLRAKLKELE